MRCQSIAPDADTTVHLEEWAAEDHATAGTQALMQWVEGRGLAHQLDGQPQSSTGALRVSS